MKQTNHHPIRAAAAATLQSFNHKQDGEDEKKEEKKGSLGSFIPDVLHYVLELPGASNAG